MTPPADSVEIAGDIRRVAIVTLGLEPWAAYLARRIAATGVEVAIVSQPSLAIRQGSAAYFKRLLRKRGLLTTIDGMMLEGLKRAVALVKGRRGPAPPDPDHPYPLFRPDPEAFELENVTVIEVANVNSKDGRAKLRAFEPDLMVLAGAPILFRRTIEIARVACINPHCGITPDFAGWSPFDRAIYEGRFDDIGYTIHQVVPKVDAGPVLHQERVPWDVTRSSAQLWPLLAQAMYDKIVEIVAELAAGGSRTATSQSRVRVVAPAGLFVRIVGEWKRRRHASALARRS